MAKPEISAKEQFQQIEAKLNELEIGMLNGQAVLDFEERVTLFKQIYWTDTTLGGKGYLTDIANDAIGAEHPDAEVLAALAERVANSKEGKIDSDQLTAKEKTALVSVINERNKTQFTEKNLKEAILHDKIEWTDPTIVPGKDGTYLDSGVAKRMDEVIAAKKNGKEIKGNDIAFAYADELLVPDGDMTKLALLIDKDGSGKIDGNEKKLLAAVVKRVTEEAHGHDPKEVQAQVKEGLASLEEAVKVLHESGVSGAEAEAADVQAGSRKPAPKGKGRQ